MLSLIIPASNEESWIGRCLTAIAASDPVPGGLEVIVVANGCKDRTADVANSFAKSLPLRVITLQQGSKPAALTAGDAAASGTFRVYLDADCVLSPTVLPALATVLDRPEPTYAGATPKVPLAKSWVTRAYARFWRRLPFARSTAPGYGLYAVNASGRARWRAFPDIISDDTFVRLQFLPKERQQVAASYDWPMVEGFRSLVKVRRRQDQGVQQLAALYPQIMQREEKPRLTLTALTRMILSDPIGFIVYATVSVAVRLGRKSANFARGR